MGLQCGAAMWGCCVGLLCGAAMWGRFTGKADVKAKIVNSDLNHKPNSIGPLGCRLSTLAPIHKRSACWSFGVHIGSLLLCHPLRSCQWFGRQTGAHPSFVCTPVDCDEQKPRFNQSPIHPPSNSPSASSTPLLPRGTPCLPLNPT